LLVGQAPTDYLAHDGNEPVTMREEFANIRSRIAARKDSSQK
jgi:hypothetical protein